MVTYIVRNFDNFHEADECQRRLEKIGAKTQMFGAWSAKDKMYIITIKAVIENI